MEKEWRCSSCGKKLGSLRDGRLHLKFARGHEYLVGFPATSVCRGCRTLNEIRYQSKEQTEPLAVSPGQG
jgi:phage FluMu protein Com